MPTRPPGRCTTPGCHNPTTAGGRCDTCTARRATVKDRRRGTAAQRGYDHTWTRTRLTYLADHPWCALCPAPATVPDHHPVSRRDLLRQGVPDPDAAHRLRPLCDRCHRRETARNQPGGWHRDRGH